MKTAIKIHKGIKGNERISQIIQGFFDGRFVSRTHELKIKYSRKTKHKGRSFID